MSVLLVMFLFPDANLKSEDFKEKASAPERGLTDDDTQPERSSFKSGTN